MGALQLLLETHDMDPTRDPHGSDVLVSAKKWCPCKNQDIGHVHRHVEDMLRTCETKIVVAYHDMIIFLRIWKMMHTQK